MCWTLHHYVLCQPSLCVKPSLIMCCTLWICRLAYGKGGEVGDYKETFNYNPSCKEVGCSKLYLQLMIVMNWNPACIFGSLILKPFTSCYLGEIYNYVCVRRLHVYTPIHTYRTNCFPLNKSTPSGVWVLECWVMDYGKIPCLSFSIHKSVKQFCFWCSHNLK